MQNEIYDEKNGLTYMLCGDYYLPELALTDIEPTNLWEIWDAS